MPFEFPSLHFIFALLTSNLVNLRYYYDPGTGHAIELDKVVLVLNKYVCIMYTKMKIKLLTFNQHF